MARMTASEAFVETLVAQGVKDVFGIVGSAYMDALDLFPTAGIRFIPTVHEQGAGRRRPGAPHAGDDVGARRQRGSPVRVDQRRPLRGESSRAVPDAGGMELIAGPGMELIATPGIELRAGSSGASAMLGRLRGWMVTSNADTAASNVVMGMDAGSYSLSSDRERVDRRAGVRRGSARRRGHAPWRWPPVRTRT